jgi:2-succinyl-5-enolpyruvyl-6-hydroxy-3-cyclohexene-1-carboxylate synthase
MKSLPEATLDFRNTNSLWAGVLAETLVQLGLRQAVICPGSRSAPLAMAFARHPSLESIPVLDERSAGFFALGLAKQRGRPVALICTSGTAAANFLPAIVEAHETGVPLLVLTADRPPELRDCHSGQTIDQQKLYGSQVNFYHECAVPQATLPMLRYLRQTVVHALERTQQPVAGPVHLNCPFRDPLPPLPEAQPHTLDAGVIRGFFNGIEDYFHQGGAVEVVVGGPVWPKITGQSRGVIIVGPSEDHAPDLLARTVGRISLALGWPVLADALSPVRMRAAHAGHLVVHYDAILRNERLAESLQPAQVICVGGWPTSKVLRNWLQRADPETVIITERATNVDGLHLRSGFVRGGLAGWGSTFAGKRRPAAYARQWLAAEARVQRAVAAEFRVIDELIEPKCIAVLAKNLPAQTPLFIASSMPVRDAEYFWPANNRGHRVHFSRGANGIDGTLSTALGLAHGNRRPAVLLTGDLALLHDTNGFLSAPELKGSLTVVLINNQGGGIFNHLPVAQFEPPFERYFATPQQADFKKLCSAYGGVTHVAVTTWGQLARLVAKLPPRGVRVLEIRTGRKRDAAWRKALFAKLAG